MKVFQGLACSKRSDSGERYEVKKGLLFFRAPFYFAPLPTIWTPGTGYSGANGCLFYTCSRSLILGHILVNNQGKRGQKWELGREKRRNVLLCLFFFPLLTEFAARSFPSSPTGTTCLFSSTLFKVRAPFPSLGTVCGGGREKCVHSLYHCIHPNWKKGYQLNPVRLRHSSTG